MPSQSVVMATMRVDPLLHKTNELSEKEMQEMRFEGRRVIYDYEELELYRPAWILVEKDSDLVKEISRVRDLILAEDETKICNGTSAIISDIEALHTRISNATASVSSAWSEETTRSFRFYCMYHEAGSREFNIGVYASKKSEQ